MSEIKKIKCDWCESEHDLNKKTVLVEIRFEEAKHFCLLESCLKSGVNQLLNEVE